MHAPRIVARRLEEAGYGGLCGHGRILSPYAEHELIGYEEKANEDVQLEDDNEISTAVENG